MVCDNRTTRTALERLLQPLPRMWEALHDWFLGLGAQYGVDPLIFGLIYVGAIPFFTLSVAWLVRNARRKQSVVLPTLAAGFFFVSAYLYLLVAGRNIPIWVYVLVIGLIVFGAVSAVRSVRKKLAEAEAEADQPNAVPGPSQGAPK